MGFNFCPKILVGGGDLPIVFCHFMNAGVVVGYNEVGGAFKPYRMQRNLFELFALTGDGDEKHSSTIVFTQAQEPLLWNFHI